MASPHAVQQIGRLFGPGEGLTGQSELTYDVSREVTSDLANAEIQNLIRDTYPHHKWFTVPLEHHRKRADEGTDDFRSRQPPGSRRENRTRDDFILIGQSKFSVGFGHENS